jgi:hypothetical protein
VLATHRVVRLRSSPKISVGISVTLFTSKCLIIAEWLAMRTTRTRKTANTNKTKVVAIELTDLQDW